MHVSEIFHSIQGEGDLAGMPSTFIRLAHCNLACSWCDAAYTWKGAVAYTEMSVAEICDQVRHEHVVLTGGEPTYADEFDRLVTAVKARGAYKHVTVETNGTILREKSLPLVDLWSVSPKLGSSKQAPMLNETVLREFRDWPNVQWKFVIDDEEDFEQAVLLMRRLQLAPDARVFMQPNGLCHVAAMTVDDKVRATDTSDLKSHLFAASVDPSAVARLETPYLDRLRWLYELVVRADQEGELPCPIRAVPQSHKLAWGNRRGF